MIVRAVEFSLRNRAIVFLKRPYCVPRSVVGLAAANRCSVSDITSPQISDRHRRPALAPEELRKLVVSRSKARWRDFLG